MPVNDRALLSLGVLLLAAGNAESDRPLARINDAVRRYQAEEPMTATLATVLVGAAAFYAAERGKNPKVNSFADALVYVSTNLSVGFSDIFAQTPLGKVLGSALMTWGPALATRTFDPPQLAPATETPGRAEDPALREVVQRLDAILVELKARAS
jgi:voltage-gated potassium channel